MREMLCRLEKDLYFCNILKMYWQAMWFAEEYNE